VARSAARCSCSGAPPRARRSRGACAGGEGSEGLVSSSDRASQSLRQCHSVVRESASRSGSGPKFGWIATRRSRDCMRQRAREHRNFAVLPTVPLPRVPRRRRLYVSLSSADGRVQIRSAAKKPATLARARQSAHPTPRLPLSPLSSHAPRRGGRDSRRAYACSPIHPSPPRVRRPRLAQHLAPHPPLHRRRCRRSAPRTAAHSSGGAR